MKTKTSPQPSKPARPFLKWAGGKTQLLPELEKALPLEIRQTKRIDRYIEPFLGGGAFFFFLKANYDIRDSVLIDINRDVIASYTAIRRNPEEIIEWLSDIENHYYRLTSKRREAYFYQVRERFNRELTAFDYNNYTESWIDRAASMIFLNHTCFNGLYRQNRAGEFNVPFGKYDKPTICDADNIRAVHSALANTTLLCGDFTLAEHHVESTTLVYFDPPYRPVSKTSSFNSYSKDGFSDRDQERLADFYRTLSQRSAMLLLSNSDSMTEGSSSYFAPLYREFMMLRVKAKRALNSIASKRGTVNEILISNSTAPRIMA